MGWYLAVLNKYADFSGRARRKEYWIFTLVNIVIVVVLGILEGGGDGSTGIIGWVYTLAVLIPSLAVTVRRLHDTDRSGWWVLLYFIPLLGAIVLFVFLVLRGSSGANKYGESPNLE